MKKTIWIPERFKSFQKWRYIMSQTVIGCAKLEPDIPRGFPVFLSTIGEKEIMVL